jgi:hypothetical protein
MRHQAGPLPHTNTQAHHDDHVKGVWLHDAVDKGPEGLQPVTPKPQHVRDGTICTTQQQRGRCPVQLGGQQLQTEEGHVERECLSRVGSGRWASVEQQGGGSKVDAARPCSAGRLPGTTLSGCKILRQSSCSLTLPRQAVSLLSRVSQHGTLCCETVLPPGCYAS